MSEHHCGNCGPEGMIFPEPEVIARLTCVPEDRYAALVKAESDLAAATARADALAIANAELRAALEAIDRILREDSDPGYAYGPMTDQQRYARALSSIGSIAGHILAQPADERGLALLEAGNALADVLHEIRRNEVVEPWSRAAIAHDRWRALVGGVGEG